MDVSCVSFGNLSELCLPAWIYLVLPVGACLLFMAGTECKISLLYCMARHNCVVDHMVRNPRPSPSIFAYCKRSKTGGGEGLGTRLLGEGKKGEGKKVDGSKKRRGVGKEREWWEEQRSARIEGGGGSVLCECVHVDHILRHSWEGRLQCSVTYCTYGYTFYC